MTKDKCSSGAHFDPLQFGRRLQSIRKAHGIMQEELADRLSVDRNHITRVERGIRVCSIALLVEMASALGVSTDYLLLETTPTLALGNADNTGNNFIIENTKNKSLSVNS